MKEQPILFSAPICENEEEWRSVLGMEGRYEVSNHGRIRTLTTYRPSLYLSIIKPWKTGRGYLSVSFRDGENRISHSVHRLVMATFVGPCPAGHQVAHHDGCRTNNHLSNLRYATPQSNIDDRHRHGRTARGSRNGASVLDEAAVKTILNLKDCGFSAGDIAHLACVQTSAVQRIWNGESWNHVTTN